MSFTYGPINRIEAPTHFTANVNSLTHKVELSWDNMPNAEGYNVYRDGWELATGLTENSFEQPYTADDNGYHTYYVASYAGETLSDYAEQWVILGHYETIHLTLSCDSPYGTKGGEVEVLFDNADMKTQYLTVYRGTQAETDLYIPANTEVAFFWNEGFDSETQGIRVTAVKQTEAGEEVVFDIEGPSGDLALYTVADQGLGLIAPQNLTAVSEGAAIRLNWTVPTESNRFTVYRGERVCQNDVLGYEFLDDGIIRSGTYGYHVEGLCGTLSTWNPDNMVYATAMNYYCEPPRNLTGSYDGQGHASLSWEAPEFVGNGLMAYDNNRFEEQIGSNSHKWGIRIDPLNLAYFESRPLTHIEMFDCSEGRYTYSIYNGEQANNNTLIYTQQHDMEGSHEWVRFVLDESVSYDATLPLWVCAASSGATQPIPCCAYVGEPNSCLIKQGNLWKPATDFGQYSSWLLRAYTAPARERSFTYNVYWGSEEGGEEQMMLGIEGLTTTEAINNTTENTRYNVTAIWDDKETDFSNTVYLGPSVDVGDNSLMVEGVEVFPNPVEGMLTVKGEGLRRVSVYSLQGAKLIERDAVGENALVDFSAYPAGIYIVTILTDEGVSTMKVTKR